MLRLIQHFMQMTASTNRYDQLSILALKPDIFTKYK